MRYPEMKLYSKRQKTVLILVMTIAFFTFYPFLGEHDFGEKEQMVTITNYVPQYNKTIVSVNLPQANYTYDIPHLPNLTITVPISQQTTQSESIKAIDYVNKIRADHGEKPIKFDLRAFNLGLARAKDMYDYGYLDHVNPTTGTCAYSMKSQFGFSDDEYVAENA